MNPNDDELSALLNTHATRHRAGPGLQARVRSRILLAGLRGAAGSALSRAAGPDVLRWRGMAAGFILGVLATLVGVPWVQQIEQDRSAEAAVVASHVRSLGSGPLIEVASADRHTVKPWFQGRIDYAPPVADLADVGFPLLGGRVDTIAGTRVAGLAYTHRKHVINVFVWPDERVAVLRQAQIRGFNTLQWSNGRMGFRVISDLDAGELGRFGETLRARTAAP